MVCHSQAGRIVFLDDVMNLCYCDESGTGDEPIAVMVGIVVDAHRMHITKEHWGNLLRNLSAIAKRDIAEIHTRNFYHGKGIWSELDGTQRAEILTEIFEWLVQRKHEVVYSAVHKETYFHNFSKGFIPDELNTVWRFLGFHLILAMQKCCQREQKNKGHTIFVFDNEERERMRFTDIIMRPPDWSGEYYSKTNKQEVLDQIVDVPYFGDSKEVGLIQMADVAAFFLRRYAEIREGLVPKKYDDEDERVEGWIRSFVSRSVGCPFMYPKRSRTKAEQLFYENAPSSIRDL